VSIVFVTTGSNTDQVVAASCVCLQQASGWLGRTSTWYWWSDNSTSIHRPEDRSF